MEICVYENWNNFLINISSFSFLDVQFKFYNFLKIIMISGINFNMKKIILFIVDCGVVKGIKNIINKTTLMKTINIC
jgi:hypothetical protein